MLAPDVPVIVSRAPMPSGRAGIVFTIGAMRRLVMQSKTDPAIIQAAISVIYLQPEKDSYSEARALFEYVRDHVRYVRDVHGFETLADPRLTLRRMVGDCDDQATLLAALLESVGYATRFVVTGYVDSEPEHVYLQTLVGDGWVDMDPTEHQAFGYAPPSPTVQFVESI